MRHSRLPRAADLRAAVIAMVLAAACSPAPPPPGEPPAALTGVSPSGPTAWPFEFTWTGASASSVVRVRVFDEAERPVFGLEARGAAAAAPDALRPLLRPGVTYQWRAARVDGNGEETDASSMVTFSVR